MKKEFVGTISYSIEYSDYCEVVIVRAATEESANRIFEKYVEDYCREQEIGTDTVYAELREKVSITILE